MAETPVDWIGSSKDDLLSCPADVVSAIGYALHVAQQGGKHESVKPLKGFGGAGVLEVIEDHDGDTYRAVYTVRFVGRIYVLDVFQKKSKRGVATPKVDMDRIRARLRRAEDDYAARAAAAGKRSR